MSTAKLSLGAGDSAALSNSQKDGTPQQASDNSPKGEVKKRVRHGASSFLKKLYVICSEGRHTDAIRWAEDGASFEVVSKESFERNVLPEYFKHSNINSFVRQLNMYDFHKKKRSSREIVFHHAYFVRDRPDLLPSIKRKTNSLYNADAKEGPATPEE